MAFFLGNFNMGHHIRYSRHYISLLNITLNRDPMFRIKMPIIAVNPPPRKKLSAEFSAGVAPREFSIMQMCVQFHSQARYYS